MIDFFLGLCIFCLGVIWFIYTIKNLHKRDKWDNPVKWIYNYKGILFSIISILMGLAFIFGFVNISTFW